MLPKLLKVAATAATSALMLTACAPSQTITPGEILPDRDTYTDNPVTDEEFINDFSELPPLANVELKENEFYDGDWPDWTTLEDFYNQPIDWYECTPDIECGYALVPTDYDNISQGITYIALVRNPATGDSPQGSLLVNPGGPGASGVNLVFNASDFITTPDVRAEYDLIGFDPRGVGYSDSVYCGPDEIQDAVLLDPGKQEPLGSQEDILDTRQEANYFAQACEKGTGGSLLKNVDTASAAKDMDIIRSAVQDEKLNYLGFSYGSQLGSVYAALFPDRVGRMVLDGAINPTVSAEESSIRQAGGFETAFNNYVDNCLDRGNCPFPGDSRNEIKEAVAELLQDIEDQPLPTELDNDLGIWPAIIGIIRPLYSQPEWPTLTDGLKKASEGDGTALMRNAYGYLDRSDTGEYFTNIGPANIAINCLDDSYSTDPKVIAETNQAIQQAAPFFARYFNNPYLSCVEWPYESDTDLTKLDYTVELEAPVLVIGTTGDPATPFGNAEDLAALLNPGVLLTHEGEGHTVYANKNACVDEIVDSYLITGVIPERELICSD
jgi:pimeloyl-ACP methyl ester carboxylesterase